MPPALCDPHWPLSGEEPLAERRSESPGPRPCPPLSGREGLAALGAQPWFLVPYIPPPFPASFSEASPRASQRPVSHGPPAAGGQEGQAWSGCPRRIPGVRSLGGGVGCPPGTAVRSGGSGGSVPRACLLGGLREVTVLSSFHTRETAAMPRGDCAGTVCPLRVRGLWGSVFFLHCRGLALAGRSCPQPSGGGSLPRVIQ